MTLSIHRLELGHCFGLGPPVNVNDCYLCHSHNDFSQYFFHFSPLFPFCHSFIHIAFSSLILFVSHSYQLSSLKLYFHFDPWPRKLLVLPTILISNVISDHI